MWATKLNTDIRIPDTMGEFDPRDIPSLTKEEQRKELVNLLLIDLSDNLESALKKIKGQPLPILDVHDDPGLRPRYPLDETNWLTATINRTRNMIASIDAPEAKLDDLQSPAYRYFFEGLKELHGLTAILSPIEVGDDISGRDTQYRYHICLIRSDALKYVYFPQERNDPYSE